MITIDGKEYPNACILGLCSSTGPESGKSYTAKAILKKALVGGKIMSFATRLKELSHFIGNILWGIDLSSLGKESILPGTAGLRLRDLYIQIGMYYRDKVDSNYWVDILKQDLKKYLDAVDGMPALVVVDDVRFLNEFDFVVESGGQVFDVRNIDTATPPIKDSGDLIDCMFSDPRIIHNSKHGELLSDELNTKVLPIIWKSIKGLA